MFSNHMEIIDDLSRNNVFFYICFFIFVICFFKKLKIKLNVIFGFIIALLLIKYSYSNVIKESKLHEKINKNKENLIRPSIEKNNIAEYEEVVNYLFSIQDFYYYNPLVYSECVNLIEKFFSLYKESHYDNSQAGENFVQMNKIKTNVILGFDTLILSMELNKEYDKKLEVAKNNLEKILNNYLEHVYNLHQTYIYNNGINTTTKFIYKNDIPAHNDFEENIL